VTEALIRVTHRKDLGPKLPVQWSISYQCGDCTIGFFVKPASVILLPEGGALLRVTVTAEDMQVLWDGTRGIAFTVDGIAATAGWDVVEAVKP
jgi:hypothetical protein